MDQRNTNAHKPESDPQPKLVSGNLVFRNIGVIALRFRWAILALSLAITGFMLYAAVTRLEVDASLEAFMSSGSETVLALEELRDEFGQDMVFQVVVEGDVFSMPYLNRLKKLHDELQAMDLTIESLGQRPKRDKESGSDSSTKPADDNDDFGSFSDTEGWGDEDGGTIVQEIVSLINARQTRLRSGALDVSGLLERWPLAEALPQIKKRVLKDKTLVGHVIDKKATHSVIIVQTAFMSEDDKALVLEEILRIAENHRTSGFNTMVSGLPTILTTLNELMISDVIKILFLASLVTIIVLVVVFRHPVGVIAPLLVIWMAEIWTLGIMALSDTPMTLIMTILPAFLQCVGLGDSIHILSVYRDARKDNHSNDEAIIYAIETTGIPVFYTTLTTAVGLLSFQFASMEAIGDMGMFGAIGMSFAFFNSVVILPIALTFNKKSLLNLSREQDKQTVTDRFLDFCNRLSSPRRMGKRLVYFRRNCMLAAGVILAVFAGVGISLLRLHHNARNWIPKEHPSMRALTAHEDTVGGSLNFALLVKAKEGKNLRDRETLLALERLEKHVLAFGNENKKEKLVSGITGILDPLRESWRAVNDDKEERYTLPDTQRGVSDMVTLFENAGPEQLRRFATIDMKRALMVVRVKWVDAMSYLPLAEHIEQGIERLVSQHATISATGSVYVQLAVVNTLLMDLVKSYGVAVLFITIIMLALLKGFKLGLLAMIPNLLPIFSVMGIMGYMSIPLDTTTMTLGSIAIGIAVDDTIHLLHQFRIHFKEHGQVEQAIQHAFNHTGRAMVMTSLILTCGFCCLLVGALAYNRWFGVLISAMVLLALVLDLCFAPALLRLFFKSKRQSN